MCLTPEAFAPLPARLGTGMAKPDVHTIPTKAAAPHMERPTFLARIPSIPHPFVVRP